MRGQNRGVLLGFGTAVFAFAWVAGAAQDQPPAAAGVAAATIAKTVPSGADTLTPAPIANAPNALQSTQALSAGVQDVLKLADAGVSPGVLKAYAESVQLAAPLTAAEVLALKQHAVPDEVATVLLKRSAAVQPQNPRNRTAPQTAPPPNTTAVAAGPAYLDPEGYDYFQYYYLRPRTLASVQATLGYDPYSYPFGYYDPFAFGFYSYGGGYGHRYFAHRPFGHGPGFQGGVWGPGHHWMR